MQILGTDSTCRNTQMYGWMDAQAYTTLEVYVTQCIVPWSNFGTYMASRETCNLYLTLHSLSKCVVTWNGISIYFVEFRNNNKKIPLQVTQSARACSPIGFGISLSVFYSGRDNFTIISNRIAQVIFWNTTLSFEKNVPGGVGIQIDLIESSSISVYGCHFDWRRISRISRFFSVVFLEETNSSTKCHINVVKNCILRIGFWLMSWYFWRCAL